MKEEFLEKFSGDEATKDYGLNLISDWWLSKIEAVINDTSTPYSLGCNGCREETIKELQQLRLKYLGK